MSTPFDQEPKKPGLFGGLRAGGPERLTVAAGLGLPQVIVPGGAEHLGIFVSEPNSVPDRFRDHAHVFHSPVIFVPRLKGDELTRVAKEIGRRLAGSQGATSVFLPEGGTSRYAISGGALHDPDADRQFFAALEEALPATIEVRRLPHAAEDPEFVAQAVARLIAMIKAR